MKRLLPFDSKGPAFSFGSGSTFSRFSRRLREREQPAQPKSPGTAAKPVAPDADPLEEIPPDDSAGN